MDKSTNSVTQALTRISDLTKQNLEILKVISESFRTKRSHLGVEVNGATYAIPSFISLETRIETMEHNLENILNAPLTGEAFVYHDGTTQKLELSGYSTTPNHVDVKMRDNKFEVEANSVFKDFMNPNPFIRIDMENIPNTIKHVNIRKICIPETSTDLLALVQSRVVDGSISYKDWVEVSYNFVKGEDFELYDSVKRLPIREGLAQGTYIIKSIEDNHIDSNFEEHFTVVVDRDLVYHVKNGTIQRPIEVGDHLVTNNDKVQLLVEDVNRLTRTITMKVEYGAYSDLQDETCGNPELYTLKYYHAANDDKLRSFNATKYINIPIEEDRYVIVFVAPINDTTNVQAPWGTGMYLDIDTLEIEVDGEIITFREYYNKFVNNIGDALASITAMMDDDEQISRLTQSEFQIARDFSPTIDTTLIKVTQINTHLNDAKSIKEIRRLYTQKEAYRSELDTVLRGIDELNLKLAELSFDDTTNMRDLYETQLKDYNTKRVELTNAILQTCQDIATQANQSDVPIENAKYHIRGFIPMTNLGMLPSVVTPIKIEVQYRYKCSSSFTGAAETYGENYIFSDWNVMESPYRRRIATLQSGHYVYGWEAFNENVNAPSFNQIDIPISQGELVDIRVRFIYNLGHPFAEMTSAWSPVISIDFPDEFKNKVEILDIITSNNDDIRQRTFEAMLDQRGLTGHIDDRVQDQTEVYKHKAENIASGFFTPERRVIPLFDKLFNMDASISDLYTEVYGGASENLLVTLASNDNAIQLKPYSLNTLHVSSYKKACDNDSVFILNDRNEDTYDPMFAVAQLNINIKNIGTYNMRLHSIFPGAHDQSLLPTSISNTDPMNYCVGNNSGVWMMMDDKIGGELSTIQHLNQFMYFRTRIETGTFYGNENSFTSQMIKSSDVIDKNGVPSYKNRADANAIIENLSGDSEGGLGRQLWEAMLNSEPGSCLGALYPYPGQLNNICIPSGQTYLTLQPGESINIPVQFVYWFQDASDDNLVSIVQNIDRVANPNAKMVELRQAMLNVDQNILSDVEVAKSTLKQLNTMQVYKDFRKNFVTPAKMRKLTVTRMMSFDIKTSLFHDPITYKFVVDASYDDTKGFIIKKQNITGVTKIPLQSVVPQTAIAKVVEPKIITNSDGTKTIKSIRRMKKRTR